LKPQKIRKRSHHTAEEMSATTIASLNQELIGVKTNCKKAYEWLKECQEEKTAMMAKLEAKIVADPDNETLHELYFDYCEINGSRKCVAAWIVEGQEWSFTNYPKQTLSHKITGNGHWKITITNKDAVRLVLTEEGQEAVRQQVDLIREENEAALEDSDSNVKAIIDFKFYCI
jgi:hypothetical protein